MARAESNCKDILLIEDDDDFAYITSLVLARAGYRVRRALDGEHGLQEAERQPPDLILLDYMMPTMDGFEACRELRRLPDLSNVPILVMTSFGQDIAEIHGLSGEEGRDMVQGHLEKPVEPNVLIGRVGALLGG